MGSISDFLDNMDWWGLLTLLISAAAALLCITLHELSHGFVAWRLGDPTAKNAGRLTLNPIRHLDVVGLLMMLVAKVGWAKPVPVDMRYFKHPRQGMALTALAGPAANFLTALAAVGVSSAVFHLAPLGPAAVFVLGTLLRAAINRPRPYETLNFTPLFSKDTKGQSMPSRHCFSAAAIVAAAFTVWVPLGVAACLLAAVVAVTRVLTGVHYPSDVLAGLAFGAGAAVIGFLL